MENCRYTVKLSPLALQDLHEIKVYISNELASPDAANNTVKLIMKRIISLEKFPQSGARLSSIISTKTNYRYLTSGSYIAFYRYEAQTVFVDRILYGKRDYLKILFENKPD